ncbi:hypothetical protein [Niallia sp. 01092]|uniref:hypothetical protein n=1 Tax=unclassified Niallia TaxID=2837522 RepID=UPI003FD63E3C
MHISKTHVEVNDYLDLYLYAGSIGDDSWQHEIIEKLKNVHNNTLSQNESLIIDNLWEKYKHINEEILTAYHQLRNQSSNKDLQDKLWELKQQRVSLSQQIRLAKN